MKNINLVKVFALIIGAVIGVLIVSHIIGCGADIPPAVSSQTYEQILRIEQDSLAKLLDDSLDAAIQIEMNLKK